MTQEPLDPDRDHPPAAVKTLQHAMRRARSDNAERAGAVAELRAAQLGRLEVLQDALQPVVAQIPPDVDLFDLGIMPGPTPRLFIDMIGFVELGRDARSYSFIQDRRHGRFVLAESEDVETMVDAVTDYIARRLLEREKAMAADGGRPPPLSSRASAAPLGVPRDLAARARGQTAAGSRSVRLTDPVSGAPDVAAPNAPRRRPLRFLGIAFSFLIEVLGAITFFLMIGFVAWLVWTRAHGPS